MIYSQVLWALALDSIIWHVSLNVWSIIGVVSVTCSLSLVSLAKEVTTSRVVGGIHYEQILPSTNENTLGIDLESLCNSEDGGNTVVDVAMQSQ